MASVNPEVIAGHSSPPFPQAHLVRINLRKIKDFLLRPVTGKGSWDRIAFNTCIQSSRQSVPMAYGMVDAWQLPMPSVIRASIQKPVKSTALHQFCIAVCRLGKRRIPVGKKPISRLASVRGTAAPVSPLGSPCPEAVIPCPVRKHKFQLLSENICQLIQCLPVPHGKGVPNQHPHRLFHIIPHIHRPAPPGRYMIMRKPFPIQQAVFRNMPKHIACCLSCPLHHLPVAEILSNKGPCRCRRSDVIDIIHKIRADGPGNPLPHNSHSLLKTPALLPGQKMTVMHQCLMKIDSGKDRNPVPLAVCVVVDTAVITYQVLMPGK